ncbi:MAG: hypothetical protein HUK08_09770, partial [Bacteroidaceae bacterium]|nr:hypothetical protein [Bacteroidaceae bacterium]
AYLCKGDAKKSIEMNLQALGGNLKMNVKQKLNIYNLIIEQYMSLHEYEKALVYSDSSLYVYDYYYNVERKDEKPDPKMLALIRYVAAKVHYNLDNYEQMRASLEFASSVYTFPGETTAEILYLWSKYYYSKKDYERSLEFLEKSVDMHRQYSQPYLWMQLEIDKTNTLRAMGREEEAFDLYVKFLEAYSSENNAMLRAQQSYLGDEISELDKLEQHEYINTWKVRVFGFVAVITVVILLFMIVYVIRAHRKILGNYNVTVQKLHEANLADKEKEHFLHNITKLINEPLQYVVQSAKLLAEDTTLTDEEKDTLVAHNKEQVGMLLKLVNNVLDLSRLEACMMKYEARNIDIIEQILDFIAKYNNHYPNARIQSEYLVDSYSMEMDVQRFVNMLNSLFPVPKENETITEERCIKVEPDGKKLVITVTGSPYGDESDFAESEKMVNKINRYVMRDFNSTYEIKDNHDIVITLNKV